MHKSLKTILNIVIPLLLVALVGYIAYKRLWVPTGPGKSKSEQEIASTARNISKIPEADMLRNFSKDLAVLTAGPNRLVGTPNAMAAADYIRGRLEQIVGDSEQDKVLVQRFPVSVGRYEDVSISVQMPAGQSQTGKLYACRPNLLAGSITPAEGITGQTVYAGDGHLVSYGANDPQGRIVLLDFATAERNWLSAFAMGAKAVVFIGNGREAVKAAHHLNIPAILPRFYMEGEEARRLGLIDGSRTVTLHSRIKWERGEGRNVIAVLKGDDPTFDQEAPEAIVLAAPIDSFGEVPDLSPGARHAANAAALLGIAEFLHEWRPGRDVIICFFDGRAQFNSGARAFYGALIRRMGSIQFAESLEQLGARLDAEAQYLHAILDSLDEKDLEAVSASALQRIRAAASDLSTQNRERGQNLRLQQEDLTIEVGKLDEQIEDVDARLSAASGDERAQLEREKTDLQTSRDVVDDQRQAAAKELAGVEKQADYWSDLQRDLDKGQIRDDPAIREYFEKTKQTVRSLLNKRLGEIEQDKAYNDDAIALAKAVGGNLIALHLTVDFGDRAAQWTIVHGDNARPEPAEAIGDGRGLYKDVFSTIVSAAKAMENESPGILRGFDRRPVSDRQSEATSFVPTVRADGGAVARLYGIWNVAAVTTFDRRPREGQPTDTIEAMGQRVANIRQQGIELARLSLALRQHSGLSLARKVAMQADFAQSLWEGGKFKGPNALVLSSASAIAKQPARDGVVALVSRAQATNWSHTTGDLDIPGFIRYIYAPVNSDGYFQFGPFDKQYQNSTNYVCCLFDDRGLPTHISNALTVFSNTPATTGVKVVRAQTLTIVGIGFDRVAVATQALRGKSTAPFRQELSLVAEVGNVVASYVPPRITGLKLFNPNGLAILNNSVESEAGVGVSVNPFGFINSVFESSVSLLNLNASRLKLLLDNQIMESSIQKTNKRAEEIQAESHKTAEGATVAKTYGGVLAANAMGRRSYQPLVDTLNDLIVAVVFLMLLTMPFAYSLERLIIGTPHIYHQIGYVTGFFLATFGILYLVNPAFRIAAAPIIIFLAFAIIVLSSVVIFIMMRKLREEIKRMQGLGTTVHSSDVSRLSTMMAAVNMGISTMRRRPIRTILTAVTVVLLTFTILTFASFSNTWGIRPTYISSVEGPYRVMVRGAFWGPVGYTQMEMCEGYMSDRAKIVPRWWVAPVANEAQLTAENRRDNSGDLAAVNVADPTKMLTLSALVGIEPEDLRRQEMLAALFPGLAGDESGEDGGFRGDGIYLTNAVTERLGLKVGDKVLVAGVELVVAGELDPVKMADFETIEGSSLMPVDYQSSQGTGPAAYTDAAVAAKATELPDIESTQFVTYSPDKVGFVSPTVARRLNARLRSFIIYPDKPEDVTQLGAEAAMLTNMPAYAGGSNGVYRLYYTTLTEASGFRDLLIPVILGGLIVFATMLGSVSDREREIYTFSALGLAPPHVASLFFAEASVYAVVGGMGGYLLGQTVSRVLGWLSGMGLLELPPINYSSSNAIVTLLIVMGTVLLSTVYPAIKASRSANPGVARTWKLPAPHEDTYDIIFPFTVSSYDITGVVSFLKEHFDNYGDTSLGIFATAESNVFREKDTDMLGFQASVALAPFDLGVTQRFAMVSRPSEIEGIEEIRVIIRRTSGSPGDWKRSNRVFTSDLRRQLLIWRALPAEVMERYRTMTLGQWESLKVGTDLVDAKESA